MPKRKMIKPEQNNLMCSQCQLSYNTCQRYKILKCSKSDQFVPNHKFISFAKYVELKKSASTNLADLNIMEIA